MIRGVAPILDKSKEQIGCSGHNFGASTLGFAEKGQPIPFMLLDDRVIIW